MSDAPDPHAASRPGLHRNGGAVLLLSAALLAWSLATAPAEPPRPAPVAAAAPSTAPPAPLPPPPPGASEASTPSRPYTFDPPLRLSGLSSLMFGALRTDGMLAGADLGEAFGAGPNLVVLNVWGTWCPPCVRELPRLLELRERDAWGRDIRFVPIHLGPLDSQAGMARRLLAGLQLLVDTQPGGGSLAEFLVRAGVLRQVPGVPLTLVLDCQRRLRWLHIGEIVDTAELESTLGELRKELSGPRCAVTRPAPAPGELPQTGDCGNGRCDIARETCASCPVDCSCVGGAQCIQEPGRPASCVHPEANLKD
ncbi:MAG: TlpA family protein disulfide reductase [Myxococcales bacterium]|nr:TlpA family protein disulfide reductase [Myxococcales bacterium]